MKVFAPNKQYTGTSASVPFLNGVGETEDTRLLNWFKNHGYELEEEAQMDFANEQTIPKFQILPGELGSMKKEELKALADALELKYTTSATNEQLIDMINIELKEREASE